MAAFDADIRNTLDIQNAILSVATQSVKERPKATNASYRPKQKERKNWCARDHQFADGVLVNEGKVLLFMQTVIEPRGNKKKKSQDGSGVALSREGLQSYVKAIIDLYKMQKTLGDNTCDHPRGKSLSDFLETKSRGEASRKKAAYEDRGVGTLLDGYTFDELRALNQYWLSAGSQLALRTRLDFMLGHSLLGRGEAKRMIQLPDLFTLKLDNEGFTDCNAVVVIRNQGKTNKHDRIEYGAAIRHKDPLCCSVGALALYLFHRWQVSGEPFPDMTRRETWYRIRLLIEDGCI